MTGDDPAITCLLGRVRTASSTIGLVYLTELISVAPSDASFRGLSARRQPVEVPDAVAAKVAFVFCTDARDALPTALNVKESSR